MSNLPPGCTEADIDRAYGYYDAGDYEETDEEIEANYVEGLEQEAATFPAADFSYECRTSTGETPSQMFERICPRLAAKYPMPGDIGIWCKWCDRARTDCACHLDPNGLPADHWSRPERKPAQTAPGTTRRVA